MSNVIHAFRQDAAGSYCGAAIVEQVDDTGSRLLVRIDGRPSCWARVAQRGAPPGVGDEVLVIAPESGEPFVLGLLDAGRADTASLPGGAYAQASGGAGSGSPGVLSVYSERKELIFEYEPTTGKARLHVPDGGLELATTGGDIQLNSGGDIRLLGDVVDVAARRGVRFSTRTASGEPVSSMAIGAGKLKLRGREVDVCADRSTYRVGETRLTGEKLSGEVESARLVAGRVETVARTMIERVKNAYRTVEQLSQLRAGRVKMLVKGLYHAKSRTARLKSERDFKIDGRKIKLG